jgi:hypothetical protein
MTYVAEPGLNSQIFPKPRYYICTGEYQPGMVVDRNVFGKILQVDFTGSAIPQATFKLTSEGNYEPDLSVEKNGVSWEYDTLRN